MTPLLDFGDQPIAHHFLEQPEQPEYTHPVEVSFCEDCGLTQLLNPAPPEMFYTQYFCLSSWKPQPHIPRILEIFNELTTLDQESNIIEIGSNDGILLEALREKGFSKLLGIEPAQDASQSANRRGLETICSYFNMAIARQLAGSRSRCDLLVVRQVLEHVNDLAGFRTAMAELLKPGSYVFFEVPNFSFFLDNLDYSSIWEEHVSYFSLETISYFLAQAGIRVLHHETVNFSGDALMLLGRYEPPVELPQNYLPQLKEKTFRFAGQLPEFRKDFGSYLAKHQKSGREIILYGAGCRACSLINYTGLAEYIDFVVDDQPEKQNLFMPGSRLPIYSGDLLTDHPDAVCLLAVNAENDEKVMAKHKSFTENGGLFVPILPPVNRLPQFWQQMLDSRLRVRS